MIKLRDDIPKYMRELKEWLADSKDVRLESMKDFFTARIDSYEKKMSYWNDAYERMAELISAESREILDLGCGTGLELDRIFERFLISG